MFVSVSVRECKCVYYGHTTRVRYSAARFLVFVCLLGLNTGLEEEEEVCNICLSVGVVVRACRCVYVCYCHSTRARYSAASLFVCLG